MYFGLGFSKMAVTRWVSLCGFAADSGSERHFACEMAGTTAFLQIPLSTWKT